MLYCSYSLSTDKSNNWLIYFLLCKSCFYLGAVWDFWFPIVHVLFCWMSSLLEVSTNAFYETKCQKSIHFRERNWFLALSSIKIVCRSVDGIRQNYMILHMSFLLVLFLVQFQIQLEMYFYKYMFNRCSLSPDK